MLNFKYFSCLSFAALCTAILLSPVMEGSAAMYIRHHPHLWFMHWRHRHHHYHHHPGESTRCNESRLSAPLDIKCNSQYTDRYGLGPNPNNKQGLGYTPGSGYFSPWLSFPNQTGNSSFQLNL